MKQRQDPGVLIDLLRRSPLLEELRGGRFDRRELRDRLDVSRATVHRHTRLLSDLNVVEQVDGAFRLTPSGRLLAEAIDRFEREATAALELARELDGLVHASDAIDVAAFVGATVTTADQGDPYAPVSRFESLLRSAGELRFVGSEVALIEPNLQPVKQLIEDGVEVTFVDRPSCAEYFVSTYPAMSAELIDVENFTLLKHDDLPPYGFGVLGERAAVCRYAQDSGTVRSLIDTDERQAREWAATTFESVAAAAEPVAPDLVTS